MAQDRALAADSHDRIRLQTAVYVYEAPVRLWHWVTAFSILVLSITGYVIGKPLPTLSGEASAHYLMGYIRFAHFAAGYLLAAGLVGRFYWALVGNHHARELFWVPVYRPSWWRGFWHEVRWYLFLEKTPKKYIGHNPLGQLAMFAVFVLGSIFMIITGFALYGEGLGEGSWADRWFGWVIPLFGQSLDVHNGHRLGMYYVLVFVMLHIYLAVREDIMSRQSLISTMVGGWRMFKDNRPD